MPARRASSGIRCIGAWRAVKDISSCRDDGRGGKEAAWLHRQTRQADAVFQGGGVKALGLVGALSVAEARGYRWVNVAGTSAGAIIAALVAAGYRAKELRECLSTVNLGAFRDAPPWGRIPLIGPVLSLLLTKGLYRGDRLEQWLRSALANRGVRTFGDVVLPQEPDPRFRFKLQVIAADISRGRMLVLPQDMAFYGVNPEDVDVARAVRMSAGLPFFYRPVVQPYATGRGGGVSHIVDGGLLSNFPVWLFDVEGPPPWPTIGFMLWDPRRGRPKSIRGPVSYAAALVSTMLEAHDALYLEAADRVRTIRVPTQEVGTADFDLSEDQQRRLYEGGVAAAEAFFDEWDFVRYVRAYRTDIA